MSQGDPHELRIAESLARAAARQGYRAEAVTFDSPLGALLNLDSIEDLRADGLLAEKLEEDEEELGRRLREMVNEALVFLAADGAHPGCVLRRYYALCRRINPKLIGNMNGTDLAMMFGETRAAVSWRNKKVFSDYEKLRGVRGFKANFEKKESTTATYAAAARGNTNRRKKTTRQRIAA